MRERRSLRLAWLAIALIAAPLTGQDPGSPYLAHDDLTRTLRALVDGTDVATMRSLGRSHEGRDIWLVEIGRRSGPPLGTRPGLLVVGNLEGDHLLGSYLALATIRHLLDDAGSEAVDAMLRDQVVYVIPRLNPDGAETMFATPLAERTRNARPFDDDNDGRIDEDPAEDLNGDGLITMMRVADPTGAFMVHPDDARLMKRADAGKGESGAYTVFWEGRDTDGDGFVNEDGPGGVDLNRNFQHAYPYWARDAGPHMVSEPETRALMDFMIAHDNVAAILTFGHADNLVTPPDSRGNLADASVSELSAFADESLAEVFSWDAPTSGAGSRGFFFFFDGGPPRLRGAQPGRDNDPESGRRPATTVHTDDVEYFKAVSDAYRDITGIATVVLNREAEGAFFQYGYFQYGVPSFSTRGWGVPETPDAEEGEGEEQEEGNEETPEQDAPDGRPGRTSQPAGGEDQGVDATLLAAADAAGLEVFVNWTPFTHPDLGEVEIGGFRPYRLTNPPPAMLAEYGDAHAEFVVKLAGMLPRVRIAEQDVTAHGGGLFTVSVEIENTGYFPTALEHGVTSRAVEPTMVQIQVDPEAVVSGDDKTTYVQRLAGSGARERVSWLIRGRAGASVEIVVRSAKGGTDTATVTLR
jgi:hypothetical protein